MTEHTDKNSDAQRHGDGAMRPIRWLIAGAIIAALMAGVLLLSTALMISQGIDQTWLVTERQRVATVADMLVLDDAADQQRSLERYGQLAGLRGLHFASVMPSEGEFIPLLNGPRRGQFLAWEPRQPGRALFERFAPVRIPMIGSMIGLVIIFLMLLLARVSRIEQRRRDAQSQAMRDPLTGLPNRLALDDELQRLARGPLDYSVLAIDLDRFKSINDDYGHAAGDLALKIVAGRLRQVLHDNEMLARVGGDEFVAIVMRDGNRARLAALARDCIATVGKPIAEVHPLANVGVSLGIVEDGRARAEENPLKLADRALYDAKRLKGNAFCFAAAPGQENGVSATVDQQDRTAPFAVQG